MTERWLPIPGASEYEVSDHGRVRRGDRVRILECNRGYMRVDVMFDDRKRRHVTAAQAVAWAFIGPQQPGIQVRHLDGVKGNNHVSNLAYGTPSENAQDTLRHGHNRQVNKTHCPQGHEYAGDNLLQLSTRPNERRCKACVYAANAKWQREKREKRKYGKQKGEAA